MIILGVVLHGICYDFFFVTGQIYTDQKAPQEVRAQAQGLLVMLTLGLGMMIGAQVGGIVEGQHTTDAAKAFNEQVMAKADEIEAAEEAGAATEVIEELEAAKSNLRHSELAALEWSQIWLKPAIFALIVFVIFIFLFRDSKHAEERKSMS